VRRLVRRFGGWFRGSGLVRRFGACTSEPSFAPRTNLRTPEPSNPRTTSKESRLRDTDDGVRHSFDGQRPAYRIGRPAEATLPETVADDGDRPTAAAIVIVGQQSAMNRPDAEAAEE
jgi:hypothetical protein